MKEKDGCNSTHDKEYCSNEMKRMLAQVHNDITVFDSGESSKVPCIIFEEGYYNEIIRNLAGKPVSVDTNLDILQDGRGHVFVEIKLESSIRGLNEKILVYANDHLDFFESLSESGMLALSPKSQEGEANVFMIQLPKKQKAKDALQIIKDGLDKGKKTST